MSDHHHLDDGIGHIENVSTNFGLDLGEKASLESEDNAILMQYLTGGTIDAKLHHQAVDSGDDNSSDDSSVEDDSHFHQFAANINEPPIIDNQQLQLQQQQLQLQHHQQQQQLHQQHAMVKDVRPMDHLVFSSHAAAHAAHAAHVNHANHIGHSSGGGGNAHNMHDEGGNGGSGGSAFYNKGRLKWTPMMDKFLKEGVEKHNGHGVGMWKKVAEYVSAQLGVSAGSDGNRIISNHQCGERYKHHLDPALEARKAGPWTDEDVEKLRQLVSEHTTHEEGGGGGKKPQINWVTIAIKLNRHYRDCQHKWINLVKAELKTGVFTKEEEELIVQRVHDWGDRGKGIWVTLEKELGRRNRSILDKYKRLVRKKT